MSAAGLWIGLPLFAGMLLLLFSERQRFVTLFGAGLSIFLTFAALRIPVNSMIVVGRQSLIFTADAQLLGRTLSITRSEQTIVAFFYFFGTLWFLAGIFIKTSRFFVPVALMDIALLVAVMAVQPFVYGTFCILAAIILSLPMLWESHTGDGSAVFRFLLYEMLGMICLSIGGWLASLVNMNPQDDFLLKRTIVMLFLGFSFWLAVFPFFDWIAALMEKTCPYLTGFVVSMLQFSALFILMAFLKDYLWMRTYEPLFRGMRLVGTLMLLIGAVWSFVQKNLQRMLAFIIVAENGVSVLLLGIGSAKGVDVFLSYLFVHLMVMLIWSVAVKYLAGESSLDLDSLRGLFHRRRITSLAILTAHFAVSGLPLTVGFSLRMSLLSAAFGVSSLLGWAVSIGCTLLLFSGFRLLAVFFSLSSPDISRETRSQRLVLLIGMALLLAVGLFPGLFNVFISGIRSQYAIIFR